MRPGEKKRLLQAVDPERPPEERQAISHLLANQQYMPQFLREQFLHSNLPVESFVDRLRKLAADRPQFAKEGAPLLSALEGYFQEPLKAQQPAPNLLPEPPEASEQSLLQEMNTQPELPKSPPGSSKAPPPPPEESQGEESL
jgi:hypothetical protein